MSKVANTYWIDSRLAAQRVAASKTRTMTLPSLSPSISNARSEAVASSDAQTAAIIRPSYILTSFIIVALFVLCFTVTGRTQFKLETAAGQQAQMSGQVEALRNANLMLKQQVADLSTNPRAIEAAARTQLGMVRANEIVIPVR